MKKQRLLILGAAQFQLAPLKYAKRMGYFTITCDNRPDNPGHMLSDKTFNISTIDKEGILRIAKQEKIDGILTFGSDISVPTVAYVCEKLKLQNNSSSSIETLTNKKKFRKFLKHHGFCDIEFKTYKFHEIDQAVNYIKDCKRVVIVKPVDSAGSKGVHVINNLIDLEIKLLDAFKESITKEIIIENFIEKLGMQICGDGFFEDGKIKYIFFGDGHFYNDNIHLAPWGETFPSSHDHETLEKVKRKIEKILYLAGFTKGQFNHDVFIDKDKNIFIIELAPRGGGNNISTAILLKYGVDLIIDNVEASLNWNYHSDQAIKESRKFYSCYMLHSFSESGQFRNYTISKNIAKNIVEVNPYTKEGEMIYPFTKGNLAIANLILEFDSFSEMSSLYKSIHTNFNIKFNE